MNELFCDRTSNTDNHRNGGPVTVNTDIKLTLKEYIKEDQQVTIQNVANKFEISYTSAQDIYDKQVVNVACFSQVGYVAVASTADEEDGVKVSRIHQHRSG